MTPKQITLARQSAQPFKGVSVDIVKIRENAPNVFRACLYSNDNRYSCGYHPTAQEAAMAYNKKAKSLYRTQKAAQKAGKWNVLN